MSCPVGLDVSFGQQGRYEIPSGIPTAAAVLAQPDCRVVVVGEGSKVPPGSNSPTSFGAVRLLEDGRADPSFGTSGTAAAPIRLEGRGWVSGAALQSDGKVIVIGSASQGRVSQWLVARLNRDGSLDATFGSRGIAAAPLADASPASVAISANGSIFVVGTVYSPTGDTCCDGNVVLARYDAGGGLDPALGAGGFVRTPVGVADGDDYATALALQPDGHVVVGGFAYAAVEGGSGARQEAMLLRYGPSGDLDAEFGVGGIVLISGYRRVSALALQGDGKLVVSISPSEQVSELQVARFTAAGALDPTFGTGGLARIQVPLTVAAVSDGVSALFSLRDGSTLVGGPVTGDALFLAKLAPNGVLDTTIALDGVLTTGLASGLVAATSDGKAIVVGNRPDDPGGATVIERVCL